MDESPRGIAPESADDKSDFEQGLEKILSHFKDLRKSELLQLQNKQQNLQNEIQRLQDELQKSQDQMQQLGKEYEIARRKLDHNLRTQVGNYYLQSVNNGNLENEEGGPAQDEQPRPSVIESSQRENEKSNSFGHDNSIPITDQEENNDGPATVQRTSPGDSGAAQNVAAVEDSVPSDLARLRARPRRAVTISNNLQNESSTESLPRRGLRKRLQTDKAWRSSSSQRAENFGSPEVSPERGLKRRKAERTILFEDLYQGGKAKYKHMIVQFPQDQDTWYILRCDEHLHFGSGPLKGAIQHLTGQQHMVSQVDYRKSIELLGVRVLNCDKRKAALNNKAFAKALSNGYKPFHAKKAERGQESRRNDHSQSRDESLADQSEEDLLQENVDAESPQEADTDFQGIVEPVSGEVYLAFWKNTKTWYAALALDVENLGSLGMSGSFADTGLDRYIPVCFDSDGKKITGWAHGFESGGKKVTKRKFPIMYFTNDLEIPLKGIWKVPKGDLYSWVLAKDLRYFDFEDLDCQQALGYRTALRFRGRLEAMAQGKGHRGTTPIIVEDEDIEIERFSFSAPIVEVISSGSSDFVDETPSESSSVLHEEDCIAHNNAPQIAPSDQPMEVTQAGQTSVAFEERAQEERAQEERAQEERAQEEAAQEEALLVAPRVPTDESDSCSTTVLLNLVDEALQHSIDMEDDGINEGVLCTMPETYTSLPPATDVNAHEAELSNDCGSSERPAELGNLPSAFTTGLGRSSALESLLQYQNLAKTVLEAAGHQDYSSTTPHIDSDQDPCFTTEGWQPPCLDHVGSDPRDQDKTICNADVVAVELSDVVCEQSGLVSGSGTPAAMGSASEVERNHHSSSNWPPIQPPSPDFSPLKISDLEREQHVELYGDHEASCEIEPRNSVHDISSTRPGADIGSAIPSATTPPDLMNMMTPMSEDHIFHDETMNRTQGVGLSVEVDERQADSISTPKVDVRSLIHGASYHALTGPAQTQVWSNPPSITEATTSAFSIEKRPLNAAALPYQRETPKPHIQLVKRNTLYPWITDPRAQLPNAAEQTQSLVQSNAAGRSQVPTGPAFPTSAASACDSQATMPAVWATEDIMRQQKSRFGPCSERPAWTNAANTDNQQSPGRISTRTVRQVSFAPAHREANAAELANVHLFPDHRQHPILQSAPTREYSEKTPNTRDNNLFTKAACVLCRKGQRKCDEKRPFCETCRRYGDCCLGYSTEYDTVNT